MIGGDGEWGVHVMASKDKKELRWNLRNLLNVIGFANGSHMVTGERNGVGPYVGLRDSEENEESRRRYEESPLSRLW